MLWVSKRKRVVRVSDFVLDLAGLTALSDFVMLAFNETASLSLAEVIEEGEG